MDAPSPPPAPDPVATANAQAAANEKTAKTQYQLNATDQITPQGTLKYDQIGTWDDGTPRFQATTQYSPEEQNIYQTGTQTRQNLADIGASQSSKIGSLLNTPYSLNESTQNKIAGLQKGFLDPQWNEQESRMKDQLINSGVRPGSEAYTRAMRDFSTNRQRAYDQSYLDAYKTAESSSIAERNQPINEITALMSGSQVSNPAYANTPSVGVAPTDVIGAQQMALNQQNLGYQAQLQQNQGMMSGLFGLGKTALGGWMMSDIRLKTDIRPIGKLDNGLTLYSFKYKAGGPTQIGVMAHEAEKVAPHAVTEAGGYKAVDYSALAEAA